MSEKYGSKWTRDETILALSFYYEMPYGRINRSNRYLQEMALKMGRSLSSLIMKMVNLASMDETHLNRGVTSLPHASKLDKEIWEEFRGEYPKLVLERERILGGTSDPTSVLIKPIEKWEHLAEKEYTPKERTILERNGQAFFRKSVLSAYNECCCITGIAIPEILQACHIKPWNKCTSMRDRLNPSNGLCLNYLLHKVFDIGFVTIHSNTKRLLVSSRLKKHPRLDETTKAWIVNLEHKEMYLPERNQPYTLFLDFHNNEVFCG